MNHRTRPPRSNPVFYWLVSMPTAKPRFARSGSPVDHSERMLRGFGAEVISKRDGAANVVTIRGGQSLSAQETVVPGDPSSAAFLAAAAMISGRGGIVVEGMMSNETRDGFYRAAALMGAHVGAEDVGDAAGERLIDMSFESADLKGTGHSGRTGPEYD